MMTLQPCGAFDVVYIHVYSHLHCMAPFTVVGDWGHMSMSGVWLCIQHKRHSDLISLPLLKALCVCACVNLNGVVSKGMTDLSI